MQAGLSAGHVERTRWGVRSRAQRLLLMPRGRCRGGHVASGRQGGERGGGGCCRAVGEGAGSWEHLQPEDIQKVHVNAHVNSLDFICSNPAFPCHSWTTLWPCGDPLSRQEAYLPGSATSLPFGASVGGNSAPQLAALLHSSDLSVHHVFLHTSLFLCKQPFYPKMENQNPVRLLRSPIEQEW